MMYLALIYARPDQSGLDAVFPGLPGCTASADNGADLCEAAPVALAEWLDASGLTEAPQPLDDIGNMRDLIDEGVVGVRLFEPAPRGEPLGSAPPA